MQKYLIIQYKKDGDNDDLPVLHVIDPDVQLPNGNKKVLNTFMGSKASKLFELMFWEKGMQIDFNDMRGDTNGTKTN